MSLRAMGVLDKALSTRPRRACSLGRSLGAMATRIAYESGSTTFVSSRRCTVVNWEPA